MKEEIVFALSIIDFEMILGRDLTREEADSIHSNFHIDNWSEYVEYFLEARGIK